MQRRIWIFIVIILAICGVFIGAISILADQFPEFFDQYEWIIVLAFIALTFIFPARLARKVLGLGGDKKQEQWLLTYGTPAKATVTGLADTGTTINDNPLVKLTMQIEPDFGSEFTATLEVLVSRLNIPRVGDVLHVRYDPQKPSVMMIVPEQKPTVEGIKTSN
jgi:nitrate/nitrite transporter NarK